MAIQIFTSILDGTCVDKAIRLSAKLWQSKRTRLSWISWAQETTQTETLDNLGRRMWQNRVHPKCFSWVWTQRASPGHIFVGWSIVFEPARRRGIDHGVIRWMLAFFFEHWVFFESLLVSLRTCAGSREPIILRRRQRRLVTATWFNAWDPRDASSRLLKASKDQIVAGSLLTPGSLEANPSWRAC